MESRLQVTYPRGVQVPTLSAAPRALGRAVLGSVSLALGLAVLEVYLRARHPGTIDALDSSAFTRASSLPGQASELVPGARNDGFAGGPVRINSLGFRGDEFPERPEPGVTRVLAIGDSVTFGYGVAEDATFHRVARARLEAAGHPPVEFLNAGLPSAGLPYVLHGTRRWCDRLDADVVLASVVLNDLWAYEHDAIEVEPRARPRGKPPSLASRLLHRSYAYTALFRSAKSLAYATGLLDLDDNPGYHFPVLGEPGPDVELAWEGSFRVLDALRDATAACDARLVLAVFPLEVQLSEEVLSLYREGIGIDVAATATDLEPQRRLAAYAAAHELPFLDFTPAFQGPDPATLFLRDLYVTLDPVHPSVLGHRLAGERLAAQFDELVPPGG
ncbi:MAG: SGNH/GDSL hydrolase family protein [Deltaproteobacteria bacterium]|nr:SGNH/GDSL hydrolase family protein [Deltaproteobacteria bacterium]